MNPRKKSGICLGLERNGFEVVISCNSKPFVGSFLGLILSCHKAVLINEISPFLHNQISQVNKLFNIPFQEGINLNWKKIGEKKNVLLINSDRKHETCLWPQNKNHLQSDASRKYEDARMVVC